MACFLYTFPFLSKFSTVFELSVVQIPVPVHRSNWNISYGYYPMGSPHKHHSSSAGFGLSGSRDSPIRPTLPQRGTPHLHTHTLGLVRAFFVFRRFFDISASNKSNFLFPADILGGNPARSLVYIIPQGYGIAAGCARKQRKNRLLHCAFDAKHAIFQ